MGTSEKAVITQIWTALIAMLRMPLFVHRDLYAWLNHPFETPPAPATEQLSLALA